MKVYKVSLFKVNYEGFSDYGKLTYVDKIIVKKKLIGVREILTGYGEIDTINHYVMKDKRLDYYSRKPDKAMKNGYHLVVFAESMVPKNRATEEDINRYVEDYENSNWKKVYDDMKVLSKDKEKVINKKVKDIYGIKK